MKKYKNPSVAIVTPIFNRKEGLFSYFESLKRIEYDNFKIVMVDDGSSDGSDNLVHLLYPEAILLKTTGNLWWAGSTNLGIKWAIDNGYDYILTYNDDQVCDPLFLDYLVKKSKKNKKSIISSMIYYLDNKNKILSGGIKIDPVTRRTSGVNNDRVINTQISDYEVDCVPGYSVLYPREVFERLGAFDNKNFPQIFMELELCLRIKKAGYKIIVTPDSVVWNDRSDKNSDPILSENVVTRASWFIRSKKSSLNYSQNKSLFKLLFKDSPLNILTCKLIIIYWMRYIIKLSTFSIFNKKYRLKLKNIVNTNNDFWA